METAFVGDNGRELMRLSEVISHMKRLRLKYHDALERSDLDAARKRDRKMSDIELFDHIWKGFIIWVSVVEKKVR